MRICSSHNPQITNATLTKIQVRGLQTCNDDGNGFIDHTQMISQTELINYTLINYNITCSSILDSITHATGTSAVYTFI